MADKPKATEAAEAKADELGVDLASVEGSGASGNITVADVEQAPPKEDKLIYLEMNPKAFVQKPKTLIVGGKVFHRDDPNSRIVLESEANDYLEASKDLTTGIRTLKRGGDA